MIYSINSTAFKQKLAIDVAPASSATDFENAANLQINTFEEIANLNPRMLVSVMVDNAVKGNYKCLVATRQKVFQGSLDLTVKKTMRSLTYGVHQDESPICAYITMVAVRSTCRRTGVASKLLREAMLIAKDEGMELAVLEVHEANTGAMVCYEKEGFQLTEYRSNSDVVMIRAL